MKEPKHVSITATIGGKRYFVGSYLVRSDKEASAAAQADLLAQIPLAVSPEAPAEDLPSFTQLQMLNEGRQRWPGPTEDRPDQEALAEMADEGVCEATDGCLVEPDGVCEHGHPSWLLYLRMI